MCSCSCVCSCVCQVSGWVCIFCIYLQFDSLLRCLRLSGMRDRFHRQSGSNCRPKCCSMRHDAMRFMVVDKSGHTKSTKHQTKRYGIFLFYGSCHFKPMCLFCMSKTVVLISNFTLLFFFFFSVCSCVIALLVCSSKYRIEWILILTHYRWTIAISSWNGYWTHNILYVLHESTRTWMCYSIEMRNKTAIVTIDCYVYAEDRKRSNVKEIDMFR